MACSSIVPFPASESGASRACSGKCKGGICHSAVPVWVIAGCEGRITLFEQSNTGGWDVLRREGTDALVFYAMKDFQGFIQTAANAHRFDRVVVVGSPQDIEWIHMALPEEVTGKISAEIRYPLMPAWFKQPVDVQAVQRALQQVLAS